MTGVRLQYIRLEIRKWFCYMKRRLFGFCVVFLLFVFLLGGYYSRISGSGENAIVHVALVIPGEQEELTRLARLLQHMESVRNIIAFVYPEEDEIDGLFESGEIQAAILFGPDFFEDVNTGVNTPVQIRLNEQFQGTELFRELLTDVVTVVDVTEAASYAMIDNYYGQEPKMSLSDMKDLIMDDNMELIFEIRNRISAQIISPTGKVNLVQYYVAILFFLFLLLSGMGFEILYDPGNKLAEEKLGMYGVGRLYRNASKLILMSLGMFLYALGGLWMCRAVCHSAGVYVSGYDADTVFDLMCFSGMLSCFYHGILLLSGERGERRKIMFLMAAILLLIGGCLVPCAYLPGWIEKIAPWTPFYVYRSYLEAVLFGEMPPYIGICLWALVFLTIGVCYDAVMGSKLSASHEHADAKWNIHRALSVGTLKEWLFRMLIYLKWQWKRKSPVMVFLCLLVLLGLCGSIHLPQWNNRTIYISGEETLCREIESNPQLNQAFLFVYAADEEEREKAVKSGQVLAAVDFTEDGIQIYTNAVSPSVLVARETVAVAYYRYAQRELLKRECEEVFGKDTIYEKVSDAFEKYMQNENLFHVEYHME